jgi:hypothetical protein
MPHTAQPARIQRVPIQEPRCQLGTPRGVTCHYSAAAKQRRGITGSLRRTAGFRGARESRCETARLASAVPSVGGSLKNHLDASVNSHWALQEGRRHHGAVLREGAQRVLDVLTAVQGRNLRP